MTEKKQKFLPEHFFMAITVISALFSFFWLAKTGGRCLDAIISGSGNDKFMDFFNHISYVREPTKVYFTSQHAVSLRLFILCIIYSVSYCRLMLQSCMILLQHLLLQCCCM